MTRKKGWEDSSNGPDWIDVESLMRAIGSLHSGHVGFSVLPRGTGFNGGVSVAAQMLLDVLPGSQVPNCVSVTADWPCDKHPTFVAHVFALMYDLDYEVGKAYQQEVLWK